MDSFAGRWVLVTGGLLGFMGSQFVRLEEKDGRPARVLNLEKETNAAFRDAEPEVAGG